MCAHLLKCFVIPKMVSPSFRISGLLLKHLQPLLHQDVKEVHAERRIVVIVKRNKKKSKRGHEDGRADVKERKDKKALGTITKVLLLEKRDTDLCV